MAYKLVMQKTAKEQYYYDYYSVPTMTPRKDTSHNGVHSLPARSELVHQHSFIIYTVEFVSFRSFVFRKVQQLRI